jgi:hypothetical protein
VLQSFAETKEERADQVSPDEDNQESTRGINKEEWYVIRHGIDLEWSNDVWVAVKCVDEVQVKLNFSQSSCSKFAN